MGRLSPFAITFKFYILKIIDVNRVSIVRILITRHPINSMFSIIVIIIIKRRHTHFLNILRTRNGRGCYLSNREKEKSRRPSSDDGSRQKIHLESRRQELFFARRDDSSATLVQQPSGYLLKRMLDTLPPSTMENAREIDLLSSVCARVCPQTKPQTSFNEPLRRR